jgi:hypothetical protein
LPSKYYLDCWRRDVKQRYTLIKCNFDALSDSPEVKNYDNLCKGMHTLVKIAVRNVDHYRKVRTHIDMLTKELCGSCFECSPPFLALSSVSLTCNESIDDVELAIDGDEVHCPIVAKNRGRLPHKRMMSTVKKSTVKKSQGKSNEPCNTNPN